MGDLAEGWDTGALEALRKAENRGCLLPPTLPALVAAACYITQLLDRGGVEYYFGGGFACIYQCGSPRITANIDVVIAGHHYAKMLEIFDSDCNIMYKTRFSDSPLIYTETNHCLIELDHIPEGWGGNFPLMRDSGRQRVGELGLMCLSPGNLLEAKMRYFNEQSRKEAKKKNDEIDTKAILSYMKKNGLRAMITEWGEGAKEGLKMWSKKYGKDSVKGAVEESWCAIA